MSQVIEAPAPVALPASTRDAVVTRVWIERESLHDRLFHEGGLLVLASTVIALSFLLPTLKSHHAWLNIPCVWYKATGIPCFACGLTRSFVFTAHGNFYSAFYMHLLGPLLFILTCGLAVYFAGSLVSGRRVRYRFSTRARRMAFWSTIGIFCVCWGIKLAFMRGGW